MADTWNAASETTYLDGVAAERLLTASQDDLLRGLVTMSAETFLTGGNVFDLLADPTARAVILSLIRYLGRREQDLLLSVLLLGKAQSTLAPLHHMTQTMVSIATMRATSSLGLFLRYGGHPTQQDIAVILSRRGEEDTLPGGLSHAIALYIEHRSYAVVAKKLGHSRAPMRMAVVNCGKRLSELEQDPEAQALGDFILLITDGSSFFGTGMSPTRSKRQGPMFRRDPSVLGQFRVQCDDPDFDAVFTSRTSHK